MNEAEFIERSTEFLSRLLGVDTMSLGPDVDLIQDDVIDSLTLIEFFAFIEDLRGEEISAEVVSFELLSTIRRAYGLLTS